MKLQKLLENKQSLFWLLQLAGWSGWAITFYLGMAFWLWDESLEMYLSYIPVVSIYGLGITIVLRALYRSIWDKPVLTRALMILVGSYIAGTVWMLFRRLYFLEVAPLEDVQEFLEYFNEKGVIAYFAGTNKAFMVMVVWSALYFGIKFYLIMQEEQRRRLSATAMAHEAQLKMLHYQLNPHFLFNTLNAISTLVLDQHTQQANNMVTGLSRFLRYTLDNDPMQKVTVSQEMEALKLYLDIEKVRFEDRLNLYFHTEPEAKDALMPSLLLQPLVENSIKYAISQTLNGGTISVTAAAADNQLILTVMDDGPGLENVKNFHYSSGKVGLSNCRERLKELYGKQQSFILSTTEPHGLTITISIPLEKAS